MIFPYLSRVIILTTVLHTILALDVCRDTGNTNCQSCNTTKYSIDDENRQNCMKSCGVCTVTNVAYNKPTNQSSTYANTGDPRSVPSHAVDGNVDQVWDGATSSCTHTLIGSPSWWCVDLQQMYNNIYSIKLFNRDIHGERLNGFELKISSGGQCDESGFNSATPCYTNTPPTNQSIYTIENCDGKQSISISARTVFVSVNNEVVTLCEVEIFSAQCSTGYYSSSSSTCQPCNTCRNDKCNPDTGVCTDGCKDTYYGDKCETSCSDKCTESKCYISDSSSQPQCTVGCVDGYKGSYCQTSCPDNCKSCQQQDASSCKECNQGWYGTICESPCPVNCVGGCGKNNGRCNDCIPDTVGSYCNLTCGTGCQPRTDPTTVTCDRNGKCTNCIDGRYGEGCDMNSGLGCDGKAGYNCSTENVVEVASISPIAIGIIGVLCGIVGTVAVGVSYHFYKKRRQSSQQEAGNEPDYVYSNTDLNTTTSTTDDTLTTGYQNIPTYARNVDYVNQSFNTEDNSRNMYDTLDHTQGSTQHTYTTIVSNS